MIILCLYISTCILYSNNNDGNKINYDRNNSNDHRCNQCIYIKIILFFFQFFVGEEYIDENNRYFSLNIFQTMKFL